MREQKQLERVAEIESQTALAGKFGIRFGIQTSDVAYLLAELRKRDEALATAKVEALEEAAAKVMGPSDYLADAATCRNIAHDLREAAAQLRAAVTGDGA